MIQQIDSHNLTQFVTEMDKTAARISTETTTERENPNTGDNLIQDFVNMVKIPHELGYNIRVIKTYDEMIGELLDIKAQ